MVAGKAYAERSEENRLRGIPIPAPRGTILDRDGEVVATSITSYSIAVLPGDSALVQATRSTTWRRSWGWRASDVDELMEKRNRRPHDLLEVTDRATFSQAAAIEERRAAFPNLMVVERPQRFYPAGEAIGHISGYVTEITREQLELPEYRQADYKQGRLIGQAGIEKQYELTLAGRDGARFVEVDAKGRVVDPALHGGRAGAGAGERDRAHAGPEAPGVHAHQIFPDTMKGAVVAMVPSTGEILTLYSHPSYDPNDFVGRIPARLWGALNTDPDKPLLDRSINAQYPPASTFKTVTAAIGIQRGILTQSHAHAHLLQRRHGVRRALLALLVPARPRVGGPGAGASRTRATSTSTSWGSASGCRSLRGPGRGWASPSARGSTCRRRCRGSFPRAWRGTRSTSARPRCPRT